MAGGVLFIGDINVDIVMSGLASAPLEDREISCQSCSLTMGSSAVIAACAYASLGGKAAVLGVAGLDLYGDFMVRGLREFRVDAMRVRRTSEASTGVTVILARHGSRTQITYPGAIEALGPDDIDARGLAGFRHVHFAGIYLQTRLAPHLAEALRLARSQGLSTSLDPQWDQRERWDRMEEWLPLLDYLFVNRDEALSISKTDSLEEACRALARRTACPVVKAGPDGALCMIDGEPRRVPGLPVRMVDSTGAGDSFDAAFLYAALEERAGMARSVEIANAAGARACAFVGGTSARSTREDLRGAIERRTAP